MIAFVKTLGCAAWHRIPALHKVIIHAVAWCRADGGSRIVVALRCEVMPVRLVGIHAVEIVKHLVTQIILLVHVILQHVLQSALKGERLGEEESRQVAIVADADKEDALAVLRHSVVLRIQHLDKVAVAQPFKLQLPEVEHAHELLRHHRLHVLQAEIFRL